MTERRIRRIVSGVVALASAVLLVGCSGGGGTTQQQEGRAPGKAANTITWAAQPQVNPDWIWPFSGLEHFSQANGSYLQALLYRPLYWFGDSKGAPLLNEDLSLASAPTFSSDGLTATVKLKGWKWSNGEAVDADDVLFWFHMEQAEKANWAAYVPGQFPDNVKSAVKTDDSTVAFTFDKRYSQQWLIYNQLGQITPMPKAWDLAGDGKPGTCTASATGCKAVYTYLNTQSKDLASYATSPIWAVVDGPWKLKSFQSDGHVSFVPNKAYSGPAKAKVKQFNEVPFTSDAAEFNVLRAGRTLDYGYIPVGNLTGSHPSGASPTTVGANPLSRNYRMSAGYQYVTRYFPYNFNSTRSGAIFKQRYFRQAFQAIVDQQGYIDKLSKGYGIRSTGPVPTYPDNSPLLSDFQKSDSSFAFDPDGAAKLLTENGWTVAAGGVTTCTSPGTGSGQCGAGIAKGKGLEFTLSYAGGAKVFDDQIAVLKSDAAKIGIKLDLKSSTFNNVYGQATPDNRSWDLNNWGGGWVYVPDYYPTGELLFQTGAGSNSGAYSNTAVDKLIVASTTESGTQVIHDYEDALAKDLPVVWQPYNLNALTETATALQGTSPPNPFGFITPEAWHY